MPSFLDTLKEKAIEHATRFRYGVAPSEKDRLTQQRMLPGAPSYLEDPAAADRYSSAYLGANKWGELPAKVFNVLALGDAIAPQAQRMKNKAAGTTGAEAGSNIRQRDWKRYLDEYDAARSLRARRS